MISIDFITILLLLLTIKPLLAQEDTEINKLQKTLMPSIEEHKKSFEPLAYHQNILFRLSKGYQIALGTHLSNACYYEPICQVYSRQIFSELPGLVALSLNFDRWTRCNRLVILLEATQRYPNHSGRLFDPVHRIH